MSRTTSDPNGRFAAQPVPVAGAASVPGQAPGQGPAQVNVNVAHTPGVSVTHTPLASPLAAPAAAPAFDPMTGQPLAAAPAAGGQAASGQVANGQAATTMAPANAAPNSAAGEHGTLPPRHDPDDHEVVYYEGSPLLRGKSGELFTFGVVGLLLIFSPFLIHFFTPWHLPTYGTIGMIAIGGILMLIPYLLTKSINYRVTNYRVDFERGLFARSIDTLELWHIEDLKFHQSFWDRLLRVGTIQIVVRDPTTPRLLLRSLPNARTLFETLKQRVIVVKRQPGVLKTDPG